MEFKEFTKIYGISNQDISREVYRNNQDTIRIKKEITAVNNLEKIFNKVKMIFWGSYRLKGGPL